MMVKMWVLQHVGCETPGTIADALDRAGVSAEYVRTFAGQPVPKEMGDAVGLIVMGGPMGVYDQDRYPFLLDELHLIEQALRDERPVLGVCLGSQLLAAALGSTVVKGKKKEIGWHTVELSASGMADFLWEGVEPSFMAYHWHGDVFRLPGGAVSLASSALTEHQAFRYGRSAYGFLFHMEVTERIIEEMVQAFGDELRETEVDAQGIMSRARDFLPRLQGIGERVFRRWVGLASAIASTS